MSSNLSEAKKEISDLKKMIADNDGTENGYPDYVNAIISAREGDADGVETNLKAALTKSENNSLKDRLRNDIEFMNYQDAVQSAMK